MIYLDLNEEQRVQRLISKATHEVLESLHIIIDKYVEKSILFKHYKY